MTRDFGVLERLARHRHAVPHRRAACPSREVARARARVAGLSRSDPAHPDLPEARGALAAALLAERVAAVTEAHRLTAEQRARIASLVAEGGRGG
jgi:hypothetical protein